MWSVVVGAELIRKGVRCLAIRCGKGAHGLSPGAVRPPLRRSCRSRDILSSLLCGKSSCHTAFAGHASPPPATGPHTPSIRARPKLGHLFFFRVGLLMHMTRGLPRTLRSLHASSARGEQKVLLFTIQARGRDFDSECRCTRRRRVTAKCAVVSRQNNSSRSSSTGHRVSRARLPRGPRGEWRTRFQA